MDIQAVYHDLHDQHDLPLSTCLVGRLFTQPKIDFMANKLQFSPRFSSPVTNSQLPAPI